MKIKTPTQFEVFNSGVCDVYTVDEENRLDAVILHAYYADRTVGIKRFYTARAAQVDISAVIRIPQNRKISTQNAVVIEGQRYEIIQVQHINDTLPPVSDLSLRQIGLQRGG